MLPKKKRLTTSLFDQVFKTGKVQHGTFFWMRFSLSPKGSFSRFAVVVPKKLAKTAVLRNRIKRIVYRAIETLEDSSVDQIDRMVIFGVKSDLSKVSFDEVAQDLKSLMLKKG